MDTQLIDFLKTQEDIDNETLESYITAINSLDSGDALSHSEELQDLGNYLEEKLRALEEEAIISRDMETLSALTAVRETNNRIMEILLTQ